MNPICTASLNSKWNTLKAFRILANQNTFLVSDIIAINLMPNKTRSFQTSSSIIEQRTNKNVANLFMYVCNLNHKKPKSGDDNIPMYISISVSCNKIDLFRYWTQVFSTSASILQIHMAEISKIVLIALLNLHITWHSQNWGCSRIRNRRIDIRSSDDNTGTTWCSIYQLSMHRAELAKEWVLKSQTTFSQILHISPILDNII